ncbi:phage tail protein [Paraburkholderia lycopersici]|uniref:P2 phage tail completion protein R (GpR) n=1 Tax=Paraburkholderia lycopersici TaxID=416944 RepID=A0A1G7CS73_9BURK|nr:phage tail protein [Paraburkholderia lycopersici]SDE41610.1 P2 phage tail completion protein R (GpR) [Paraburkholderia lycopersici]
MNKAISFRAAIADAVPALQADPDKLLVFVDTGKIIATAAPSLSFQYSYTLNVIVTDFAGDADELFVALIAWVQLNQPDLVMNDDTRKNGIAFEVDHLTQTTCDVSIKLQLTESVIVKTDDAGTRTITHVDEPVYEWNVDGLTWTN